MTRRRNRLHCLLKPPVDGRIQISAGALVRKLNCIRNNGVFAPMKSAYGFGEEISSPGPTWHAASTNTAHTHVQLRTSLVREPGAFIRLIIGQ